MIDVLVVGSGASAVNAAWPLVKAGLRVVMLDAGIQDRRDYAAEIPSLPFSEIRRTDENQHDYFLGRDFEGIPFGPVRVGAQLTPPRQYLTHEADNLLPVVAKQFEALRSFARGGFASGWGASAPPFTDDDMRGWPITRDDLQPSYANVAERIGVCGENDPELREFLGGDLPLLPPAKMDSNAAHLMSSYRARKHALNHRGFHAGAARLACVTKRHRGRGPLAYHDMEFWADKDEAIYRPVYTLHELMKNSNFEYVPHVVVESFADSDTHATLSAKRLQTGTRESFTATKVILSTGTICTADIVLRSLGNARLPIVSNPYVYYPCFVWSMLGRKVRDRRHSLTQLVIYHRPRNPAEPLLQAQVYGYRSLLTYKLLKESPLPHRESIKLLQLMQNYFVIVGLHHQDLPTKSKIITLDGDRISVSYQLSTSEKAMQARNEAELMRNFSSLGCRAIKRIDPGAGASIHYGGTLPMTHDNRPFTTAPNGRLRGTRNIHIADGSVFPHLPSKGLTFTLMANADRIGSAMADEFKKT